MKLFLKILLVVFIAFVANLKVASATITVTNIQEITTSFSFHNEILRTTFKVFENKLANCCQNEQDLVDYGNRGERVKANAAKGGANLTKSQLKAISSLEKQIATHTDKLKAYKADPWKFDSMGHLKNAPNDAVRQKIIQSRINHLEKEIQTFQNNIQKILSSQ